MRLTGSTGSQKTTEKRFGQKLPKTLFEKSPKEKRRPNGRRSGHFQANFQFRFFCWPGANGLADWVP
jgi:hypothetical protein